MTAKAFLGFDAPTPEQIAEAQEAVIRVRAAEKRGRRVRPTALAYNRLARRRGPDGIAEALIARANTRWRNLRTTHEFIAALTIPRYARAVAVDHALAELGMNPAASPWLASAGPGWLPQIRWGADSVGQALRLLFLGQVLGSASVVRSQVERWTYNRAHAIGAPQREGESNADFISRTWNGAWQLPLDAGQLYRMISDLLHGRGAFIAAVRWEASDLCSWSPPPEAVPSLIVASQFSDLVLQQCTACCLELAHESGDGDLEELLLAWPARIAPIHYGIARELFNCILPLMPANLIAPIGLSPVGASSAYQTLLANGLPTDHDERRGLVALAFLSRRGRAVLAAVDAFGAEAELLGREGLDARPLYGRHARYVLVGELAALIAKWLPTPHGDALATASSALRSAFILWLEDDTRAMIPVRSILESAARARSWRLKPARAARLEGRGSRTSSGDWLAAAGWRRLGIMNVALGELAHTSVRSRWSGAIDALANLADEPEERLPRIHTARGDALDRAAHLLAIEACASAEVVAPDFAVAARHLLGLSVNPEPDLERVLVQIGGHGRFDFGPPSFEPIDEDLLPVLLRRMYDEIALYRKGKSGPIDGPDPASEVDR